ncbi:MAG TPA: RES family NAD+ phosphorylase, partial [Pirellulales bacterium]|nr:RES family NAD+ phosphorylase [Pirellulales bacterium]
QAAVTPAGQGLIQAGALRPDPVVMIGAHVRAAHLLDLRDPLVRNQLGIQTVMETLAPWKGVPNAPTQILGEAVFNDGHFEGILYLSAQNPGHDCIVLFPTRLLATSEIDFRDPTTGSTNHLP